jgi:hypothetical protein
MPATDIPTVIALTVASVGLALLTPGAVRSWRTYSGVSARRQEDATGRAPAPEGELAERIGALETLGYRRIGETWTSTPVGAGFAWVLASADEETYALLVPGPGRRAGLTGFYSAWQDSEWLGTMHPGGSPYMTGGLRISIEKGTFAAAEAGHRAEAAAMSVRHGSRRRIATLADVLALDAEYRTRFGGRELRPQLYRALLPVVIWALMVGFFLFELIAPH